MLAEADLNEYLDEIRKEVCSRCVERPPGGPPCGPLGKPCGIELHLPQLIDAVHQVRSDLIEPYLDANRETICPKCPFWHSEFCPCPMETLVVLLVEAIEAVDARRNRLATGEPPAGEPLPNLADLQAIYRQAATAWVGCDWHTVFGPLHLDLKDMSSVTAGTRAASTAGSEEGKEWVRAAQWLAGVERVAREALFHANLAMTSAGNGDWCAGLVHARKAWALEVGTGRPLRHYPPTWQRFYEAIAALARQPVEEPALMEG